ncbi:MAG: hypothetical protein ABFR33_05595 [Verrucomicrobiota bacterium]
MKKLIVTLMVFAMASSSMAAIYYWQNDSGVDSDSMTAGNWADNGPNDPSTAAPGTADFIYLGVDANSPATAGTMNVTAGIHNVYRIYAYGGQIDIAAGARLHGNNTVQYIGRNSGNTMTINVEGALTTSTTAHIFYVGFDAGSHGQVNISGSGYVDGYRYMSGWAGTAQTIIEGDGWLRTRYNNDAQLSLDSDSKMLLRDNGKIFLFGDRTALVAGYIASGYITTDQGGSLVYDYDGTWTTVSIYTPPPPIGDISIEVVPLP